MSIEAAGMEHAMNYKDSRNIDFESPTGFLATKKAELEVFLELLSSIRK